MELIIMLTLIYGLCKGICDNIQFHDGYKDLGYFWSKESWQAYYDSHKTWLEKLMGAAVNAWHVLDWTRNLIMIFIGPLFYYLWNSEHFIVNMIAMYCAQTLGFSFAYNLPQWIKK